MDNQSRRKMPRLAGFDYSQAGAYFVTICTQKRVCTLGEIVDAEMIFSEAGRMVQEVWLDMPSHYPGVGTDAFVVMPNHVHGIIILATESADGVGAGPRACLPADSGRPQGVAPTRMGLSDVVHRFKSFTTARYRHGVKRSGWPPFPGRLWQRNYYEDVIRKDDNLLNSRQYIENNPRQWDMDNENPDQSLLRG